VTAAVAGIEAAKLWNEKFWERKEDNIKKIQGTRFKSDIYLQSFHMR
jgi:hypothetical protein